MKRLMVALVISFCLTTPHICLGENPTTSTEDLIKKNIEIAKSRYVGLIGRNVEFESNAVKVGTAFMVNSRLMVSNFHILTPNHRLADMNDEKGLPFASASMNIEHDILVLQANSPKQNLAPIEFAETVELGEILVSYSNADSANGFARVYRVAKLSGTFFLLDQPSLPGESGSALLNLRGQFAGLVNATKTSEAGQPLYGKAISASVVKLTLDKAVTKNVDCK